jgi:hypothetical protein
MSIEIMLLVINVLEKSVTPEGLRFKKNTEVCEQRPSKQNWNASCSAAHSYNTSTEEDEAGSLWVW